MRNNIKEEKEPGAKGSVYTQVCACVCRCRQGTGSREPLLLSPLPTQGRKTACSFKPPGSGSKFNIEVRSSLSFKYHSKLFAYNPLQSHGTTIFYSLSSTKHYSAGDSISPSSRVPRALRLRRPFLAYLPLPRPSPECQFPEDPTLFPVFPVPTSTWCAAL